MDYLTNCIKCVHSNLFTLVQVHENPFLPIKSAVLLLIRIDLRLAHKAISLPTFCFASAHLIENWKTSFSLLSVWLFLIEQRMSFDNLEHRSVFTVACCAQKSFCIFLFKQNISLLHLQRACDHKFSLSRTGIPVWCSPLRTECTVRYNFAPQKMKLRVSYELYRAFINSPSSISSTSRWTTCFRKMLDNAVIMIVFVFFTLSNSNILYDICQADSLDQKHCSIIFCTSSRCHGIYHNWPTTLYINRYPCSLTSMLLFYHRDRSLHTYCSWRRSLVVYLPCRES